jgi:hypothetical protein
MLRAISVIVAVALAGCPATGEAPDAGRDAGDDADVPAVTGGLVFDFGTDPAVPGAVGAKVHVDEVRVFWHDVRAIGDSAPGDSRTSRASLDLVWRDGESPESLAFPLAPPGLYSRLEARVGGGQRAYEIKGTVTLRDDSTESFEVSDEALASISVSLAGVEVSSATVTARVTMSLAFLSSVDWDALWDDRHDLKIEAGDPAIAAISGALATSFAVTDVH